MPVNDESTADSLSAVGPDVTDALPAAGSEAAPAPAAHKRGPGAPRGNTNALKHGLTAKRDHRTRSDRRREQRDMRAILAAYGLESDPLALGVVKSLVRNETEARWCERFIQRRGRVDKNGEPKSVWRLFLDRISPQSDAWRKVLEMLLARRAPETPTGDVAYYALFSDGQPVPTPGGSASLGPPPSGSASVLHASEPVMEHIVGGLRGPGSDDLIGAGAGTPGFSPGPLSGDDEGNALICGAEVVAAAVGSRDESHRQHDGDGEQEARPDPEPPVASGHRRFPGSGWESDSEW